MAALQGLDLLGQPDDVRWDDGSRSGLQPFDGAQELLRVEPAQVVDRLAEAECSVVECSWEGVVHGAGDQVRAVFGELVEPTPVGREPGEDRPGVAGLVGPLHPLGPTRGSGGVVADRSGWSLGWFHVRLGVQPGFECRVQHDDPGHPGHGGGFPADLLVGGVHDQ